MTQKVLVSVKPCNRVGIHRRKRRALQGTLRVEGFPSHLHTQMRGTYSQVPVMALTHRSVHGVALTY